MTQNPTTIMSISVSACLIDHNLKHIGDPFEIGLGTRKCSGHFKEKVMNRKAKQLAGLSVDELKVWKLDKPLTHEQLKLENFLDKVKFLGRDVTANRMDVDENMSARLLESNDDVLSETTTTQGSVVEVLVEVPVSNGGMRWVLLVLNLI